MHNAGPAAMGMSGAPGQQPFDPAAMSKFFANMGWGAWNPMMMGGMMGGMGGMPAMGGMGGMPGMGGMGGFGNFGMPGMMGMGQFGGADMTGGMGGMGAVGPGMTGAGGAASTSSGSESPGVSQWTAPMAQPMRGGMGGGRGRGGARGGFNPPVCPYSSVRFSFSTANRLHVRADWTRCYARSWFSSRQRFSRRRRLWHRSSTQSRRGRWLPREFAVSRSLRRY